MLAPNGEADKEGMEALSIQSAVQYSYCIWKQCEEIR